MWLLLSALALAAPDPSIVQGMTVSCPTWGFEWGTDEMVATLDELQALGVNWVAIHPYASIRADGTVAARPIDPASPPVWLTRPIAEAHKRGMQVLIKPHLAYWGSPWSWRGAISFADPAARARFFASYIPWVTQLAAATAEADAFAVGTELDGTVEHEAEWRAVIASVRAVQPSHLTYAANWDRYEDVPFWDALDAVGIQAYFPLLDAGTEPTPERLDAAWTPILQRMHALKVRTGKPVVFTELGYPRSARAAVEPWASTDQQQGEPVQVMALEAALRAVAREEAIVGAFLWKWFPGQRMPHDFAMQRPAARGAMARAWSGGEPPR